MESDRRPNHGMEWNLMNVLAREPSMGPLAIEAFPQNCGSVPAERPREACGGRHRWRLASYGVSILSRVFV